MQTHKIIHIDMDCFYAAVEIRDNPALQNKPVAVGAPPEKRGVICTCNYIAREYGVHSAMPTRRAYALCKDLVLLPVNMAKYRAISTHIRHIFHQFTPLVEPLSLDEAYLDVTASPHCQGSATRIAQAICQRIWQEQQLTASAGVAPNKFLAKIASAWRKPNGLLVIRPHEVDAFVRALPITKLYGVGKVTAEKLHRLGIKTCADLQQWPLAQLLNEFGKMGYHLYEQCRGEDSRQVEPNRVRKSISVETTFVENLADLAACLTHLNELYAKLLTRIAETAPQRVIKNQFIKIKFSDFQLTTAEITTYKANLADYVALFRTAFAKAEKSVRLLGLGVHFQDDTKPNFFSQQALF